MNKRISLLLGQLHSLLASLVIDVSIEHHFGAVTLGPLYFNQRSGGGHHNHRLCPITLGGVSHPLRMVSRRGSDQTFLPLFLCQGTDLVIGAPQLICPCQLHVFRLKIHFVVRLSAEIIAVDQLGLLGYTAHDLRRLLKLF